MVGGRLDDGARAPEAPDTGDIRADLRHAYERGRQDERGRRRRHPVFMTVTFICAIVGLVSLVLAGVNGSFARGGEVMDSGLAIAANRAGPVARQAADNARQKVGGAASPSSPAGIANGAG